MAEALVGASYLSSQAHIDGAIQAMHILKMPFSGFHTWNEVVEHASKRNAELMREASTARTPPMSVLGYTYKVARHGRDALVSGPGAFGSECVGVELISDAVFRGDTEEQISAVQDSRRRSARLLCVQVAHPVLCRPLSQHRAPNGQLIPVMVQGLFNAYPSEGPGSLTVMRHSRHGDACLAAFSVVSGLIDRVTDVPMDSMPLVLRFKRAVNEAKGAADSSDDGLARREFWADIPSLSVSRAGVSIRWRH